MTNFKKVLNEIMAGGADTSILKLKTMNDLRDSNAFQTIAMDILKKNSGGKFVGLFSTGLDGKVYVIGTKGAYGFMKRSDGTWDIDKAISAAAMFKFKGKL